MQTDSQEPDLLSADLDEAEAEMGLRFPKVVREFFLQNNGGRPKPNVYEDAQLDTVVAGVLPILSDVQGTAIDAYLHLVVDQALVPRHFFPFAFDLGGDYFSVDCASEQAMVYFYQGDTIREDKLVGLGRTFDEFWSFLKAA